MELTDLTEEEIEALRQVGVQLDVTTHEEMKIYWQLYRHSPLLVFITRPETDDQGTGADAVPSPLYHVELTPYGQRLLREL